MWRRCYSTGGGPFRILQLPRTASSQEIKQQYIKLAKQHHPDCGGSETQFRQVQEAYLFLKQPRQRKVYLETGFGWNDASSSPSHASSPSPAANASPWGTPRTGKSGHAAYAKQAQNDDDHVTYRGGVWSSHQHTRYMSNAAMFWLLSGLMTTLAITNFVYTPFAARWLRALDAHHDKSVQDLSQARSRARQFGNQQGVQRVKDAAAANAQLHPPSSSS
ncbi:hypothetical protein BC940DRAFT_330147 [Gongronella butleri]|nr:hypothetical protein BC940DRAFT_330147 [Gongronella butleri]